MYWTITAVYDEGVVGGKHVEGGAVQAGISAIDGHLGHQHEMVLIGVLESRHPQLILIRFVNDMRWILEGDAPRLECLDGIID